MVIPSRYSETVLYNPSYIKSVEHSLALGQLLDLHSRQDTGARVPSAALRISSTVSSSADFASMYPPLFPLFVRNMPLLLSSGTICSRYFFDIPCRCVISFKETQALS